MIITSPVELERLRSEARAQEERPGSRVLVCCGTGCRGAGALEVWRAFEEQLAAQPAVAGTKLEVLARRTGCQGFCEQGPLVVIAPADILYTRVQPADVPEIVERTVCHGEPVSRLLYRDPRSKRRIAHQGELSFYRLQHRVATRRLGRIDPGSFEQALAYGAYAGLARALGELTPQAVLEEIERSGLRGRGGAGFSTARKWNSCRNAAGERKLVLCNGDEGDPGAFKDCALMEGDPHAVVEGMTIGAYAVGAHEGWIYVRDEYPVAVEHLTRAVEQARSHGLLGANILGRGFAFDIRLARGGGAFVCGESSALMRSIEGKTGEPRVKYIHATERGLFGAPTVLNNVETWVDVAAILAEGAEGFAALGTARSKGTKTFSLVGKVRNTGLIELPMGTSLRHIIFEVGGGMLRDRPFKAVQTGGPSGGVVPEALLDLPVDYEQLTAAGSMMGSGGMIVMDDRTCMVDVARYFLRFLVEESCGKCTPCREGLRQLLGMLDVIVDGCGREEDLARIERLCAAMRVGCLCELGKSAVNPVLSTLQHFRAEYEAHVREHACPAGVCRALTRYAIIAEACTGCGLCVKACPTHAIHGEKKAPHVIDAALCTACGACFEVCRQAAISSLPKAPKEAEAHAHAQL